MSLLSRAENAYLNILRVVILAIATLALLGAVFGIAAGAAMFFGNQASGTHTPADAKVSLGDFMAEQKASIPASGPSAAQSGSGASANASAPIKEAVRNLTRYLREKVHGEDVDANELTKILVDRSDSLPAEYRNSFEQSLVALTHQLTIAKGRPLTFNKVGELLDWHMARFKAKIEEDQGKRAGKAALGKVIAAAGGTALVTFLLLVFCFLFVKIERNLRVVQTITKVVPS
jgi:hypothetical protein